MEWKPITKEELIALINSDLGKMTLEQRKLWGCIQICPEKWKQETYGNEGNGFWVVAIIGKQVVWYNDIEDGFNKSVYKKYGEIDEYWSNQDHLGWTLQYIINEIADNFSNEIKRSQPINIE